jgi:Flp pilus assembly protein TadD
MERNLTPPYDDLGRILFEKRAHPEAISALEKAVSLSNRSARCLSSLAYAYAVVGRKDLAREILAELTAASKQRYIGSSDFAIVNTSLGQRDEALHWLERAWQERDSHLPFLHVDPRLVSLRTDPRFKAVLNLTTS